LSIATVPVEVSPARRIALAASMFLTTACIGFLQPFLTPYLQAVGLSAGQIGFVVGVGTGLALLIQPLLGRLSDRWDARRPLMIAAALVAGAAYLAFRFVPPVDRAAAPNGALAATLLFTLLHALGTNGTMYLTAAGGVLVARLVERERAALPTLDFGFGDRWGSS
jgi:MFS family permease